MVPGRAGREGGRKKAGGRRKAALARLDLSPDQRGGATGHLFRMGPSHSHTMSGRSRTEKVKSLREETQMVAFYTWPWAGIEAGFRWSDRGAVRLGDFSTYGRCWGGLVVGPGPVWPTQAQTHTRCLTVSRTRVDGVVFFTVAHPGAQHGRYVHRGPREPKPSDSLTSWRVMGAHAGPWMARRSKVALCRRRASGSVLSPAYSAQWSAPSWAPTTRSGDHPWEAVSSFLPFLRPWGESDRALAPPIF